MQQERATLATAQKAPRKIRVSLGSAIVLGLLSGKLDAAPTTAYLMTYKENKCTANCGFCPQAQKSHSKADMLSRVSWPVFPTEHVLNGLEKAAKNGRIKRVCLQALNYPEVIKDLIAFARAIRQKANVQISVSCQPLNRENIRLLAQAGAERIGIPLDAATEDLFDEVKGRLAEGPYSWERQFELLSDAVNVFGEGKVSTHLIVGLGETEQEMVETVQRCVNLGILPALFAFTPIAGTALENKPQPSIQTYRRIQLARYIIVSGIVRCENMRFDEKGCITGFGVDNPTLLQVTRGNEPFVTSGSPDCNRPYYNEKPSGPIYNYPKKLTEKELDTIKNELGLKEA
ncbi:radical SAM protein [Candidatus Bathyarchaeota archaeon]|nr:radical SAM protein [Candidatus Bathyarchaeota archaeon]